MRIAALLCALAFVASCSQPVHVNWLETAQLVEGAPAIEASTETTETQTPAEAAPPTQPTHRFFIGEGDAPVGATLNVWAFKIESNEGQVGAFHVATPSEPDFNAEVFVDGQAQPLFALVRAHSIENPLVGLYRALPGTSADFIPCSGRPLTHAVFVYHPFRADLAISVFGFAAGAPGEDGAIYCGMRSFHIPQ
ncbi:hypothetical protein [Vitreimonas sp.]|uniref:hypothetical protein n=1 Tax=Vitreimonas sp. TaxID=3069702 RepID=UPI002EDA63FB